MYQNLQKSSKGAKFLIAGSLIEFVFIELIFIEEYQCLWIHFNLKFVILVSPDTV